jgi:tetraacyldisaccharide 4'-kinase
VRSRNSPPGGRGSVSISDRWSRVASGKSGGVGGGLYRALFAPAALGYSAGVAGHRSLYKRGLLRAEKAPCKVVSVGNLTVGGTGKTPFVAGLSREFTARGVGHCVLCYGYGARNPRPVAIASDGRGYVADWTVVGDEAAMLAGKLEGVPVIAARRRILAARRAVADFDPAVLILDDGFQYWRLERDLDIVLLDSERPFGNGWLFPAGTLRERKTALARADVVVLNRGGSPDASPSRRTAIERLAKKAVLMESDVQPVGLWSCPDGADLGLGWVEGKTVALLCAIANPDSFERSVRSLGARVQMAVRYGDHHAYSVFDLRRIVGYCKEKHLDVVVTTAKDAVRLEPLLKAAKLPPGLRFAVLDVETVIREPGSFGAVAERVLE